MPNQDLLRSTEGNLGIITLNRPDRRNPLSLSLMLDLIRALDEFGADKSIRAVILASTGKAFSSGHDLSEMVGRTVTDYRRIFDVCSELMTRIQSIAQPVIAQVQGVATAAGCQLVASCDLAVASEAASFATPGVDIGLFCSTPMVALSRNVPRKQAMEMLLTGEPIPATTARDIGLVNHVVAAGTERGAAIALAQKVALKSAYTVKLGKTAFYRQAEMSLADAYRYAAEVMTENMMARDAEEGISAFIEKREPKWQDR